MSFMERMLAKKDKVMSKTDGNFEKINWFRPSDGDQKIRILPHIKNLHFKTEVEPFHEIAIHFLQTSPGKGFSVRCERDREDGGNCPYCNKHDALMKSGDKERAKEFRPRKVAIANVLNYSGKVIQPYQMPSTVYQKVFSYFGDYGNVFSLEDGRDWKLTKGKNPARAGRLATEYAIIPLANPSAVPGKAMGMIEEMDDINKFYSESGVADMNRVLGVSSKEDSEGWDDEPSDDEVKKSKPAAKAKPKADDDEWASAPTAKSKAEAAKAKTKAKPVDDDFDIEKELEDGFGDLDADIDL